MTAALSWRGTISRLEQGDVSVFQVNGDNGPVSDPRELQAIAVGFMEDDAETMKVARGADAAQEFGGVANGVSTPLLLHVDAWLRGWRKGPLNPRTASDLAAIAAWARTLGVTIEGFTNIVAGRFVTEELVAKGVH